MSDLRDGESAEVWGSGAKPYQLKDVGGVYGRIGTAGQTNNKQFPTMTDVLKHVEKLIRERTAKGYVAAV